MRDPARTAVVAHPGAELYGSDRMTLETVAGLVARDWHVVLAVPSDGPMVAAARELGAEVVVLEFPVLRKRMLQPAALLGFAAACVGGAARIAGLLRRARPDAVYVATLTIPLWVVVARFLRLPVLAHVHESERGASRLLRRALAEPVALASRVLVNSAHSRDALLETTPRLAARSTVLFNGVAGPPTVTAPRTAIDGPFRLVYTGRISPRKGVDVAVESLGVLVAGGLDARLDVVGDVFVGYEWFLESLRARVDELGLTERVRFTGFQREVWSALGEADMALVPSRDEEPFGNTAVEAVLAGRPVVVSAIGGLAEAIDGFASAVAVAPADPDALAGAIRRVAANWSAYRRTAIAMAPIAAARYAPERYRTAIADELQRMVEPLPVRAHAVVAG